MSERICSVDGCQEVGQWAPIDRNGLCMKHIKERREAKDTPFADELRHLLYEAVMLTDKVIAGEGFDNKTTMQDVLTAVGKANMYAMDHGAELTMDGLRMAWLAKEKLDNEKETGEDA